MRPVLPLSRRCEKKTRRVAVGTLIGAGNGILRNSGREETTQGCRNKINMWLSGPRIDVDQITGK